MYHSEHLPTIVDFLRRIGIAVEIGPFGPGGFLPGVVIQGQSLRVDPEHLAASGDLLHEAGHIAVVPSRFRHLLGEDAAATLAAALAAEGEGDATDWTIKAPMQTGEMMAIAWSYAALLEIGLPAEAVFFPGSYHTPGDVEHHPAIAWLASGTHTGAFALAQAGMCGPTFLYAAMLDNGLPPFPQMARWLQA